VHVEISQELAVCTVEAFGDIAWRRTCRFADLIAELAVAPNPRAISYWDQSIAKLY
jgi:hypothetical protein